MKSFAIGRSDGRSNTQVILDLVKDQAPGSLYSYEAIAAALAVGHHAYDTQAVRQIVRGARARLLNEQQRALRNVVGVGYKLAHANEHLVLSQGHQRRGQNQLKVGLAIAREVRWDEMDDNTRKAHQAHLMVAAGMYQQMSALERRMGAIEKAIKANR